MIIPTGANDPRMTTAKRQTLADFMYYSLCEGQSKAGPVRLLAAAAQPGAGRLRPDREAARRPTRTSTSPTATCTKCNNPTFVGGNLNAEQARPDRAAARGLRQGRRRARAAPRPAPTSRPPTTATAEARRGAGERDGTGDGGAPTPPGDGGGGGAGGGPVIDPETGRGRRRPTAPTHRRRDLRRPRPSWSPTAAGDQPRRSAGSPSLELLALVLLPGLCVAGTAPPPPARHGGRHERAASRPSSASCALGRAAAGVAAAAPGAERASRGGPRRRRSRTRAARADGCSRDQDAARVVRQRRRQRPTRSRATTSRSPPTRPPNLRGRQRILISWKGAQPSGGRASNPYGENGLNQEYPVVIMQCRGTDDPILPARAAAAPRDLLDQLGRAALADHAARTARRSGPTTSTPPRPTRPAVGHGPVPRRRTSARPRTSRPTTPTSRRSSPPTAPIFPACDAEHDAAGGGGRCGVPAGRDRRLHRRRRHRRRCSSRCAATSRTSRSAATTRSPARSW